MIFFLRIYQECLSAVFCCRSALDEIVISDDDEDDATFSAWSADMATATEGRKKGHRCFQDAGVGGPSWEVTPGKPSHMKPAEAQRLNITKVQIHRTQVNPRPPAEDHSSKTGGQLEDRAQGSTCPSGGQSRRLLPPRWRIFGLQRTNHQ